MFFTGLWKGHQWRRIWQIGKFQQQLMSLDVTHSLGTSIIATSFPINYWPRQTGIPTSVATAAVSVLLFNSSLQNLVSFIRFPPPHLQASSSLWELEDNQWETHISICGKRPLKVHITWPECHWMKGCRWQWPKVVQKTRDCAFAKLKSQWTDRKRKWGRQFSYKCQATRKDTYLRLLILLPLFWTICGPAAF